ncbi:RNI-like protein [Backusella circina FSU 941]|nr:RNI-like protein [Backusella circina FSU 941]
MEKDEINIQTAGQLLSVYQTACRNIQEPPLDLFVSILDCDPHANCLTKLNLTNQAIDRLRMGPLVDTLSIGFGIKELVLDNCQLEDNAAKILLHNLLLNDKITSLSLANNPKLKSNGFKYIAIYIKASSSLSSLNISFTQPDKKSMQYISSALDSNISNLSQLVMDSCSLRATHLEILASGTKKSKSLKFISLRNNFIMNQAALSVGIMLRDYDSGVIFGLERLDLSGNELLGQGIQYISQALRRNQNLRQLTMQECKVDAKGCLLIAEALKYNQRLERLDISANPLCTPNLDGMSSIAKALRVNQHLKSLVLSDIGLNNQVLSYLGDSLPGNKSLVRLDISNNTNIDPAGLLAISSAIQKNSTLCFIDINIPTHDRSMTELYKGIVNACTKNAATSKEAAAINKPLTSTPPAHTTAHTTARLTLQERLAAVTRGKNIRPTLTSPTSSEISLDSVILKQPVENVDNKPKKEEEEDDDTKDNTQKEESEEGDEDPLSSSFEIGDDDDSEDEEESIKEERESHLKELRNEFAAQEGAAFLQAKKDEQSEELEELE